MRRSAGVHFSIKLYQIFIFLLNKLINKIKFNSFSYLSMEMLVGLNTSRSFNLSGCSPLVAWSLSSLPFVFPLMSSAASAAYWNKTSGERRRKKAFTFSSPASSPSLVAVPSLRLPLCLLFPPLPLSGSPFSF